MKPFLLSLILSVFVVLPSCAQESLVALPDGHTALNISATERVEVDEDTLQASLRIQKEMESAVDLQNWINTAMKKAVDLVKQYPEIKLETGQYYVRPDYTRIRNQETGEMEDEISKWRATQTLTFKTNDETKTDDVLMLAGQIQDMGFVMNSLSYHLSREKREETRDNLMEATITKLRERAERIAKALGKTEVDFVEINVDSHSMTPRPMYARVQTMEMSVASDSIQTPSAEAGTSDVSMTISARAIIK